MMLLSTAWFPVKLVGSLFPVTDDKLNCLNTLKMVLLNGYKPLGD